VTKRDPDTAQQEDLFERIRRFPEKYPVSMGGLRPDTLETTLAKLEPLALNDPTVQSDRYDKEGQDEMDNLGVHALDDGEDTFFEDTVEPNDYDGWPQDDLGPDPSAYDDHLRSRGQ
jgi:hypothetical protein